MSVSIGNHYSAGTSCGRSKRKGRSNMLVTYIRARLGIAREEGQALVEYALIISLIAVAAILALGFLSGKINQLFTDIGNQL